MAGRRVGIIGGGAAGFFGAIACAETYPDLRVDLFEAGREPLAKVRISGGGRCNVTHHCFDPAELVQNYPRGSRVLRGPFSRFQPQDTIAWFEHRGVRLKTEADGRMFPVTDDSQTVVDCLMEAADQAGVVLHTRAPVQTVEPDGSQFRMEFRTGREWWCDRILLATGGHPLGYRIAQSLGHTLEPPVPSLFTFNVPDPDLHLLAGIAVEPTQLQLQVPHHKPLKQNGPLLITHWGLSGPAILKLSAWGARLLHDHGYRATLQVNWLPQMPPGDVRQTLVEAKQQTPRRALSNHCPLPLPRRLWRYLVKRSGITDEIRWAEISKSAIHELALNLTQGIYRINGKGVFKEEFVTCGGVRLQEVDFKTMASRCCPGLFLAGEILDIDGITGGFNFQSAWTTGWLAGQALGQ